MSHHRILVADDLGEEGIERLRRAGTVVVRSGVPEDELRELLADQNALVVRSATKVTARSLELAKDLVVIGRAGIGVDNIDIAAATERGIVVMNTPGAGAVTTGELAIALLVSLARRIPAADASMKSGLWSKKAFTGVELRGKVLGVLGLGRIGGVVANRGMGLSMEVIAHDPFVSAEDAPDGVRMVDLDRLLEESDFVSVHVPLSEHTRGLLDRERIGRMKEGAFLIHAARGGIVQESAVIEALQEGRLGGAALDVFETEPLPEDHPLRSLDNVILTPHLGASTEDAKRRVATDMADQIALCLETGVALNGINVPRISPSTAAAVRPYLDLTRNLAGVLGRVFDGAVTSVRVTVQGPIPTSATEALTTAAVAGLLQTRSERPVTLVNAMRMAETMGVRVDTELSTMKRDFLSLVRVEAIVDGARHFVSGTVLGHRHGRLVELDDYLLDAIPEGPLLVTFHSDEPGVVGAIGTMLGRSGINIDRIQLGTPGSGGSTALGIWNLDRPVTEDDVEEIGSLPAMRSIHLVPR